MVDSRKSREGLVIAACRRALWLVGPDGLPANVEGKISRIRSLMA